MPQQEKLDYGDRTIEVGIPVFSMEKGVLSTINFFRKASGLPEIKEKDS